MHKILLIELITITKFPDLSGSTHTTYTYNMFPDFKAQK